MKKLLIAILLLSSISVWSQDTIQKKRKEYFRIYWSLPSGTGNNVISKANKSGTGIGLAVTFVTFNRFHLLGGYEFSQFDVTDKSKAGNVDETNVSQFYLGVLYKIPLTRTIGINPQFNVGAISFKQTAGATDFGRQSGPALTPGFTVDYNPTGNLRLFAGLNYCLALPKTNTADEFKSYFGTIQILSIVAGIKL